MAGHAGKRRSRTWCGRALACAILPLALALAACGDDPAEPRDRIVAGVNLTTLFAPATDAEIEAVLADWSTRDPAPAPGDVLVEQTFPRTIAGQEGEILLVRLTTEGVDHYGAIQRVTGAAAGSQPVLLVAHGGDGGTGVADLDLITAALGALAADFVVVAPAFRGEPFRLVDGEVATTDAEPSPWDRDVDDALGFIAAAAGTLPQVDPSRTAVLGFSRGGGVALLAGIRSPAIDQVIDFFGPTDMFSGWVEDLVALALGGTVVDLPGLGTLTEQVIRPLQRGEITMGEARLEMVRRSSVLFAERLPATQVHHGGLDFVVPVSQSEALIDVMAALGREPPRFEGYIYPSGRHDPFSLPGSIDRALEALQALKVREALAPAVVAAR